MKRLTMVHGIVVVMLFAFGLWACPGDRSSDPQATATPTVTPTVTVTATATPIPGVVTFSTTYGGSRKERGQAVIQLDDGGYAVFGYTHSFGAGYSDAFLWRTDGYGQDKWLMTYGGPEFDDAFAGRRTAEGGFVLCGETNSFGADVSSIYLIKTDLNGRTEWSHALPSGSISMGYDLEQASDGGYLIAGSVLSGDFALYAVKTDNFGNVEWSKVIPSGSLRAWGYSLDLAGQDAFVICGERYGFDPATGWNWDVYVAKLDYEQNILWGRAYGGPGDDSGLCIRRTMDGGYIICGITNSFGNGRYDVYLIKIDDQGHEQWSRTIGNGNDDFGYSIVQTADTGYIITGYTLSQGAGQEDVILVKTDCEGNEQWLKTYGGSLSDQGRDVQQTLDGGYIITGFTNSTGAGKEDVYLIKTDEQGELQRTTVR